MPSRTARRPPLSSGRAARDLSPLRGGSFSSSCPSPADDVKEKHSQNFYFNNPAFRENPSRYRKHWPQQGPAWDGSPVAPTPDAHHQCPHTHTHTHIHSVDRVTTTHQQKTTSSRGGGEHSQTPSPPGKNDSCKYISQIPTFINKWSTPRPPGTKGGTEEPDSLSLSRPPPPVPPSLASG